MGWGLRMAEMKPIGGVGSGKNRIDIYNRDDLDALRAALREAEAQREEARAALQAWGETAEAIERDRLFERGRAEALADVGRRIKANATPCRGNYVDIHVGLLEELDRVLAGEPRHTDECRFQHGSGKWECCPDCPTLVAEPGRELSEDEIRMAEDARANEQAEAEYEEWKGRPHGV